MSPTPFSTTRPTTTTPTATATRVVGLAPGAVAMVTNSPEGECLLLRGYHTRQPQDARGKPIDRLCDGALVTITGGRVEDEGYIWYPVRTSKGQEGWSAEGPIAAGPRFLVPVR